jgi:hypothetical protein
MTVVSCSLNLSDAMLPLQMDDVSATRSRASVSARLRDLIRKRPRLTVTLNVDRLRTLLLFLGFEAIFGLWSYASFVPHLPEGIRERNFVEILEIDFPSPHEFVIASMVIGACVFWLVRLLLLSKNARWLSSLVFAYLCLVGRNYLVASIFFSTALLLMAISDIKSRD